jgi:hypothetical protein
MFEIKKPPFPNTSEECRDLLEAIISAMDSSLPSKQSNAYTLLEIVYNRRCKKVLTWLYRYYSESSLLTKQQFAKKALEYRKRLGR